MLGSEDQLTRNSYYLRSALPHQRYEPLHGSGSCDVCIVGGGLAGLSAAIELRRAGLDVVVLEAMFVGWGASGRNGGQVLSGLACDMSVVRKELGKDAARAIWDMTVEAVQLIGERRREFAIDCHWQDGFIAAAIGAHKAWQLRAWVEELERDYGYSGMQLVDRPRVRQWVDTARYEALAFDPRGGHLHPLRYTQALAQGGAGLGVRIYERTRATALERGAALVVRTASGGALRCRYALLAANVYLEDLLPEVSKRIMPVGTFVAASARIDAERARALIPSRACVSDTQFVLDYFRLSADDRMLFGGRVSYSTVVPRRLASVMRRRMLGVFPQLHDVPIEYCWGGFVDITMNRAPDFGRIDPNLYYVQGFSGHGLALSGLAGKLVAEAIMGTAARFDVFARMPHHVFPGGRALRMPALILATAWYRLRDLLS